MHLRTFDDYAHCSEILAFHCMTQDAVYLYCRGINSIRQLHRPHQRREFWIHPHKWQICHSHRSVPAACLTSSCSCSSSSSSSSRCPHSHTSQHRRWPALFTSPSAGRRDTILWLWPAAILCRFAFLQLNSLKFFTMAVTVVTRYFPKIEVSTVWRCDKCSR